MYACWQFVPERRPTFAELTSSLSSILSPVTDLDTQELSQKKTTCGLIELSDSSSQMGHTVQASLDHRSLYAEEVGLFCLVNIFNV